MECIFAKAPQPNLSGTKETNRIIAPTMSEPSFPSLREQEGQMITLGSPFFGDTVLQKVRLIRVEDGGIWVENHKWNMEQLKKTFGISSTRKTMIFFLPWHQISTIVGSLDAPSFSEESLGL
jgi:hypothetical protein